MFAFWIFIECCSMFQVCSIGDRSFCWVTTYFKWSHDSVRGLIAYHNVYRNVLYPLLFHILNKFVRSKLDHSLSFITYYCNNIRWLLVPLEDAMISPFYIQETTFFIFYPHNTLKNMCLSNILTIDRENAHVTIL